MGLGSFTARVVNRSQDYYGSGDNDVTQNPLGHVRVAQGLPSEAELARFGETWSLQIATGSAFAPVAAMPTTLANLVLYNGDAEKTYLVHAISAVSITSQAAAVQFTLLAQVVNKPVAPTDDAAQLIESLTGQGTYTGSAKRAVAQSTMTANKWTLLQPSGAGASASIGLGAWADVRGLIQIPPGKMLGVNLIAGTAVGTAIQGIIWSEVKLPIQ